MSTLPSLELSTKERLRMLRRLDPAHAWNRLRDQRRCLWCGDIFTGAEVDVLGGTRATGPLRLQCPGARCVSGPANWAVVGAEPVLPTNRPEEVVLSHHGRACTLRRTKRNPGSSFRTASAPKPLERCRGVLRELIARLHLLPAPTQANAAVASGGGTKA